MSSLSDSYKSAIKKKGGLKFKGQKKKDKKKRKKKLADAANAPMQMETRHGAFWLVKELNHLRGNILIESQSGGYLTAVDDGTLTTAVPRPVDNDPDNFPDPQDIITVVPVGDSRVAFKTAYNRYVTAVPDNGEVKANNEAMTTRELWEPILQGDGIIQFRSADKKYLNGAAPGQMVHANSEKAAEGGIMFRVHTSMSMEVARPKKQGEYDIDGGSGSLKNMEKNFVKKFQSFQELCFKEGSKITVTSESRKSLKKAKDTGKLHETLLNRRSKIKGDKFCK